LPEIVPLALLILGLISAQCRFCRAELNHTAGPGKKGPGKKGPGKNGPVKTVRVKTVLGKNGSGKKGPS